jgi:oligopeptide/dipeptide ABC transporter ATP-binding protein
MTPPTPVPLLEVHDLHTHFQTRRGTVKAVDGVSLTLHQGEIVALLGESGCGKSVTSLSIMGLITQGQGTRQSGRVLFEGQELLGLDETALQRLRGHQLSMIFQEPLSSLNPVMTVGQQIAEVLVDHGLMTPAAARDKTIELLREVGLSDAAQRFDAYPHELSGGMCQRIMIAMAIACDPKLLIADEPTTALDVTIQKQILQLLSGLRERRRTSVLLITHDLGVVAENADRVLVMYAGKVIEQATVQQLFEAPAHPYTQGLIDSTPNLDLQGGLLASIPGHVPDLARLPAGCAFAPRCSHAQSRCHVQMPDLSGHVDQRQVRCWFPLTLPVKA